MASLEATLPQHQQQLERCIEQRVAALESSLLETLRGTALVAKV